MSDTLSAQTIPVVPPDAAHIARASAALRVGELVIFPTETVYGLGANASDDRAVAHIFATKGRPRFNPLIVHVQSLAAAYAVADFDSAALALARAFWPGPLTLVLPRLAQARISHLACAGLDSVAIRVPAHPVAQALLTDFGGPLVAPSANPSGRLSATRVGDAIDGFHASVAMALDGGPCAVGLESTIVGLLPDGPTLLRPGGLSREQIETVCGPLRMAPQADKPSAPGQLASHYAPRALMRLNAAAPAPGEAFLAFGPAFPALASASLNLSASGDLVEAAANLFAHLRALDATGARVIAVAPIPNRGLGEALNDRLARAAAPREV